MTDENKDDRVFIVENDRIIFGHNNFRLQKSRRAMRKGSIPCSNPCASIDSSRVSNTDEKQEVCPYGITSKCPVVAKQRVRHEKEHQIIEEIEKHFKEWEDLHFGIYDEIKERVFGKVKNESRTF